MGFGVGRGLGVAVGLGVGRGFGVAVGLGKGVGEAVGVALGDGVGSGGVADGPGDGLATITFTCGFCCRQVAQALR
jgi:hypothetical protein